MINYMRSELYRIFHSAEIYVWIFVFAVLVMIMNVLISIFPHVDSNFPYATTRFSLSMLISTPLMFLYAAMIIGVILSSGELKNGTIKNTIAYGISREQILIGKCISYTVASIFSMCTILVSYIGSAVLLLQGPKMEYVQCLLVEVLAVFLLAVAAQVLTIVLVFLMGNVFTAIIDWYVIIIVIPGIIHLLGYKFPVLAKIASWMPGVFLKQQVTMNMSSYQALWDTPEGMFKCIFTGCIGILVFSIFGIFALKKMEV